jgi:hypothetical protein
MPYPCGLICGVKRRKLATNWLTAWLAISSVGCWALHTRVSAESSVLALRRL